MVSAGLEALASAEQSPRPLEILEGRWPAGGSYRLKRLKDTAYMMSVQTRSWSRSGMICIDRLNPHTESRLKDTGQSGAYMPI